MDRHDYMAGFRARHAGLPPPKEATSEEAQGWDDADGQMADQTDIDQDPEWDE